MDLQGALKEWQEALRLQDWDITAEILPVAEYEHRVQNKNTWGHVDIYRTHMAARILINEETADKENTLVHELVHILLEQFNGVCEQAITMAPGAPAQAVLDGSRKHELEIAVNAVTRAIIKTRDIAQQTRESPKE